MDVYLHHVDYGLDPSCYIPLRRMNSGGYVVSPDLDITNIPMPAGSSSTVIQNLLKKIGRDGKLRSYSEASQYSVVSADSENELDGIEYIEMQPQGEQPASLEQIVAAELYPKKPLVSDDASLTAPYPPLPGESIEYLGRTADGVIALSNFRLFIKLRYTLINIPLALIDTIECRDIFFLYVYCKDARSHRCVFSTNETCMDWYKRLSNALNPPRQLKEVFAFAFHAWCLDDSTSAALIDNCYHRGNQDTPVYSFGREVERMGFDLKNEWRICYLNDEYKICPTYPKLHIVPSKIKDEELKSVATFRSSRRFPSVVWRDQRNGAVIVRSSQPEVGWLGWRSERDEQLLQAISKACLASTTSTKLMNGHAEGATENGVEEDGAEEDDKKMLIIDARSYAAAVANRAKGGGCECPEYYENCEIQFMSLANIHSIRRSFQALRTLCASAPDQTSWLSTLESTKWLQHIAGLMRAALIVVSAVDKEARPVLVHCSDGWDRTPQIVGLAQLMLDPFYRTIEGFQVLVEREWFEFGHKFADRCALGIYTEDTNERCPVFLQFLDCVHQLLRQFPCAFQFNEAFLVKLVQHTYSCLFGSFLCNSAQEREKEAIQLETCSVWALLKLTNSKFRNYLYTPNAMQVLRPSCHVRNLSFWPSVYLSESASSMETLLEEAVESAPSESSQDTDPAVETTPLTKTHSLNDIVAALADASSAPAQLTRRLSDPNIASDPNCLLESESLNAEKKTVATVTDSEKDESIDNEEPGEGIVVTVSGETSEGEKEGKCNGMVQCGLRKRDNAVIESSTDTLTGELYLESEAHLMSRNGSNLTLNSERVEETGEECKEEASCVNGEEEEAAALENCISISTSTTELSDSHIHGHKAVKTHKATGTMLSLYIPESSGHPQPQMNGVSLSHSGSCNHRTSDPLVPSSRASNSSVESESCSPAQQQSRTPSTTSPPTPGMEKSVWPQAWRQQLDCDGLTTWLDAGQMRLVQMEAEYQARIEHLQRQLHLTRLHFYNAGRNGTHLANKEETGSQAESQESGGEQASLGGSDMSWEHIEERDAGMTLWVPDHAVTHCAGCDQEFWIVRRRHHCRNCGQIFCGECTKFCMALPQQQLNEPVRVCRVCFSNFQSTCTTELACSAFTTLENDLEKAASISSSCSERTLHATT